eukprot:5712570-Pleurochrysis_carterae.AAC.5
MERSHSSRIGPLAATRPFWRRRKLDADSSMVRRWDQVQRDGFVVLCLPPLALRLSPVSHFLRLLSPLLSSFGKPARPRAQT